MAFFMIKKHEFMACFYSDLLEYQNDLSKPVVNTFLETIILVFFTFNILLGLFINNNKGCDQF